MKDAHKLPENVLADEKHTRFNGQKAYIATTVADDCVLDASVSLGADAEHLTEAYGHQDGSPKSVNRLCSHNSQHRLLDCYPVGLDGFVYHDNWLHNILISASLGCYRQ